MQETGGFNLHWCGGVAKSICEYRSKLRLLAFLHIDCSQNMLPTAVACAIGGVAAKYVGMSLAGQTKDLENCIPIVPSVHRPDMAKQYGYFRGTLNSDQPNKIQDKDSGIEYSVVGVRKITVQVYNDKVRTVHLGTGSSTETRGTSERVLSDTGNQYFGKPYLIAEVNNNQSSDVKRVECSLGADIQKTVPFPVIFSQYQSTNNGTTVVINNGSSRRRSGDDAVARNFSHDLAGTRTDVCAAKVGTELTVIGDFSVSDKGGWIALPASGKFSTVTEQTFEECKAEKEMAASFVSNVGTGLLIVGTLCGVVHVANSRS